MSTKYPFHMRIVRSDGAELELGDGTEWVLSMNGMDDWLNLDYSVVTSANVLTDGSALVSKRVAEKDRTISATYWGRDRTGERDRVIPFFNPKYSFEAHITYFDRTRWCEGEQIGFDMPIVDERTPPTLTWTLLCLDPYLRSEDGHEHAFGDAMGTFGWPFISVADAIVPGAKRVPVGFPISVLVYDGINTIYNSGDVSTTYTVRIEAKGFLRNPTITKDGRFVKVLIDMEAGQVLVIDFQKTPPTVELDGSNIIGLCSRDSSFTHMAMQTGANLFTFTIDNMENYSLADVQILYNDRYTGV